MPSKERSEAQFREYAMHNDRLEQLKVIRQREGEGRIDLNALDSDGRAALHKAAFGGHVNVVRYLLDEGADINAADFAGDTAMHTAAAQGHVGVDARPLAEVKNFLLYEPG